MNQTARHQKERRWLQWVIVAVGIIPVLISTFGVMIFRASALDLVGQDLQGAAVALAESLDKYLVERSREVKRLTDTLASMKHSDDGERWSVHLRRYQGVHTAYDWIGVLDATGRVVAATDKATIGFDAGETDWFKEIAAGSSHKVYDVQRDDLFAGRNVVEVFDPITAHCLADPSAPFHGFVVGRIAITQVQTVVKRLLQDWVAKGGHQQILEYMILTGHGRVITGSVSERDEPVDLVALGVKSAAALGSGRPGFIQEEHMQRHVPVVTGYAPLPSRQDRGMAGWGVLLRIDRDAVLGTLYSVLWIIALAGSIVSLLMTAVLLWNIARLRSEWRDTELAKQAARDDHEFVQLALDAVTSHIAILDERATIITVNKSWRQFGDRNQLRDHDHAVGRNYLDICRSVSGKYAEDAHSVADGIQAVLQGLQSELSVEYPCHAPGEQRWYVVRISRFTIGEKCRIVVDHQNVTDNWLAAQALRANHAETQAIISGAMDAHMLMDQQGLVVGWNPKAEAIFGWPSEAMVGKSLAELIISPGYRAAHRQGLKNFLNGGAALLIDRRFESEGLHREGYSFPIEITVTALERPSGFLFSAFVRDITERKQAEQRLVAEHQIAELLLEAPSLDAVGVDIIRVVCTTLQWELGLLWTVNEKAQVLRHVEEWGGYQNQFETFLEQTRGRFLLMGEGLPGRVWGNGEVEWVCDATRDSNFLRASAAEALGLHAGFAFPIKVEGEVQVVMEFYSKAVQPVDPNLVDLFDGVASQLSHFLERDTVERKLRRSEARLSGILQLAEDAIVSINDSQRIVLFNKGAERVFGYMAEEVLGQSIDLLIPDRVQGAHRHHVQEFASSPLVAKRMMDRSEIGGRRKNGEEFLIEASIARVTVEGETTYTAILRDISQRKQEEQILRDAKALAELAVSQKAAVLATVEACFIGISETGVVCEWSGRAEEFFAIPLVEAIGRTFQDLSIDWSWEVIQEAIGRVTKTVSSVHLEKVQLATGDNRQRFLKLTVSPLCKASGGAILLMGEDITERLDLERDLVQAQKLESIGHLAAGIAHEINTPTQFVGDNLRFLSEAFGEIFAVLDRHRMVLMSAKTGSCAPALIEECEAESRRADLEYLMEEIPKAVAQSSEGVERVAKIVRAMKEFAHPVGDDKTCVDLNRAIESTATVARNEWKYVADLTTDLANDLPPVPCLVDQFNQVILNLIVNASHAIADTVKGTSQKGAITITSRRVGECAEIRVTDTGAGIPEHIRHKIFDPFFTTKGVGKGTGQGLAISHSVVVDKHGGTITFDSQVGKGTTFIIRLPLNGSGEMGAMEHAA